MKSYDFANIINGLYEQLVLGNKKFSYEQGIYFVYKIDCQCHGYENDGNTHHHEWENQETVKVHFIMLNGHQIFTCNTNSVMSIVHELPKPEYWKNASNHDSCWREVSYRLLTDTMFHCHDEAYKNCPKEFRPETKSQEVRFSLATSLSDSIFKYVEVEKEADYDLDKSGYHNKLTTIKFIDKG